jgi:TPR repeat protein
MTEKNASLSFDLRESPHARPLMEAPSLGIGHFSNPRDLRRAVHLFNIIERPNDQLFLSMEALGDGEICFSACMTCFVFLFGITWLFWNTICYHGAVLGFPYFEYHYALWLTHQNGTPDWKLSAYYLNLSANKNFSLAQYKFSRYLASGCGVPQDLVESMRYLKLAADDDLSEAQYDYGLKLSGGEGIPMNDVEATRYFKMAAQRGYPMATYEFGKRLNAGRGIAQNRDQAVLFFKYAASQGVPGAQVAYALALLDSGHEFEGAMLAKHLADRRNSTWAFLYGKFLRDGIGVPRNLEAAAAYFKWAADHGNADAQEALKALSNAEESIFQNLFTDPVWKIELTSVKVHVLSVLFLWIVLMIDISRMLSE